MQPVVNVVNGQQVYEWQKKNVPSLSLQDYTPSWYDPYAQILVSEYNSWQEVNTWAMELFPVGISLSAPLQKKINEIKTKYTSDDKRTAAALKFVQDDIRYMGIEMGENSHKPADPSKIFAQRFGDCKEKSYLLCCMLHSMGIDARPVLINTNAKKSLYEFLPAPTDFDHVTVRVKLDNSYYWFDPTISYQRGDVKNIFYPDYRAGMLIGDSTVSLTDIHFRNTSYVNIKEYFTAEDVNKGGGTLKVVSVFQGGAADDVRSDFNSESISNMMTNYQKFYSIYYDDIKADSLTYKDDDSTGLFTVNEYYTLSNFWTKDKANNYSFDFSAFIIKSLLVRPKEKDRKMPFKLVYPAKYLEESFVTMPVNWSVTENEMHLKNTCFSFNSRFYNVDNKVYLKTDYENFKDNAGIVEAKEYFRDINDFDEQASFKLTSGKDEPASKSSSPTSSKDILLAVLIVVLTFGGLVWRSQRRR